MASLENHTIEKNGRLKKRTRGAVVAVSLPADLLVWLDRYVQYCYHMGGRQFTRTQAIKHILLGGYPLDEFAAEYEYQRENKYNRMTLDWEECFKACGDSYRPNKPVSRHRKKVIRIADGKRA